MDLKFRELVVATIFWNTLMAEQQ